MLEIIKRGAPQFKANLHSHSTLSDGHLTPEEMKALYKNHGYSVLAITDHELPFDHSALSDDDFIMLTGYEIYIRGNDEKKYDKLGPEIHFNLYARDMHNTDYIGYDDDYCHYIKDPEKRAALVKIGTTRSRTYTPEYVNEVVATANANGYICSYNHPYWSMEDWSRIEQYEGFFSMEMCNYNSHVENGLEHNGQLYEFLLRRGKRMFCHSGDDNHNSYPVGHPLCDSLGAFTYIIPDEFSYSGIFEALEKGDFYSSMGPEIKELYIKDGVAHIETSPARQIIMHYGGKRPPTVRAEEGKTVSSADFIINPRAPFVRFSVIDREGRSADTRGIFRDEFDAEMPDYTK